MYSDLMRKALDLMLQARRLDLYGIANESDYIFLVNRRAWRDLQRENCRYEAITTYGDGNSNKMFGIRLFVIDDITVPEIDLVVRSSILKGVARRGQN